MHKSVNHPPTPTTSKLQIFQWQVESYLKFDTNSSVTFQKLRIVKSFFINNSKLLLS